MLNRWLDPLDRQRIEPWLLAVGSLVTALSRVEDLRRHEGWVLDWLALVLLTGAVPAGQRASRSRRREVGAPVSLRRLRVPRARL